MNQLFLANNLLMKYTSKIFVTVDVVVLDSTKNTILLIQRKNDPFKGMWALPGGFVDENEDLEVAAHRELLEETSVKVTQLFQIGAYGKPGRDPRQHTVSIAFAGIAEEAVKVQAADDASDAKWFDKNNLPDLAFDHLEIITDTCKIME